MNMEMESRKHHYVPEFLLKPWLLDNKGQKNLCGLHWNRHKKRIAAKWRGLNAFCFQIDLLSLRRHKLGRDAIEKIFFGEVDNKGAVARDVLVEKGVNSLSREQRSDFGHLLLSLDARRPNVVEKIRSFETLIASMLDNDPEAKVAAKAAGIKEPPSKFFEKHTGTFLADRALANIQKLVDNPTIGTRLINATWSIVRFREYVHTLVLSDWPLIRLRAYDDNDALWLLPLIPKVLFIAANNPESIRRMDAWPADKVAQEINAASAMQAERFVFSTSEGHRDWLKSYLRPESKKKT